MSITLVVLAVVAKGRQFIRRGLDGIQSVKSFHQPLMDASLCWTELRPALDYSLEEEGNKGWNGLESQTRGSGNKGG